MKFSLETKRNASIAGLVALSMLAIFAPDPAANIPDLDIRSLSADHQAVRPALDRRLATGQCEVPISVEDFEGADALNGWSNGLWETGSQDNFTKFLGRYNVNTTAPYKTYNILPSADTAIVELDFYELDSWDGGDEKISIFIDDEEVDIGDFQWDKSNDSNGGTTAKGIVWTSSKITDPQHLGFSGLWWDQMHRVSLRIPKSSGLYNDGQFVLKMVIALDQDSYDESGGWDNIKVAYEVPCTDPPTPSPVDQAAGKSIGVNGDPLIMGLKGQLFKFNGRSGAWYSAISTPTFQWNMKISQYDGCPADSDTFCSGAGFTFFDSKKRRTRKVEVNVVNEHSVNIGCGDELNNCLGAGSLEIMLDGKKMTVGGDYKFGDGSGRVLAFNTFYQCARKWYDFEEVDVPEEEKHEEITALRASQSFDRERPGVFDVMDDLLKDTMIDKQVCDEWLRDRKQLGDLFEQGGRYSTIIIQTETVTFHVEYKQENERCNAHSVNVWMSSVSPELWNEPWEGVIGETKDGATEKKDLYSRQEVLKFPRDEDYEVKNPFSTKCKGCVK